MILCSVQVLASHHCWQFGHLVPSSCSVLKCNHFSRCQCSLQLRFLDYYRTRCVEWCAVLQSGTRTHLPPSPATVVAALPVLPTDPDAAAAEPVGGVPAGLLALACVTLRLVLLDEGAGCLSSGLSSLCDFFDFLVLAGRSARASIRRSGTGVYCVPRSLLLEKRTPSLTISASSSQNRRCGNHSCFQSTLPPSRRCVTTAPPPLQNPQQVVRNALRTSW